MSDWHWENAAAGAITGFATVAVLHPLDVVRTRFQLNDGRAPNIPTYKSTGHAFYTIASYSRAKQRQLKDNEEHLSPSLHLVSAAEAGALVCLCTNPIWLVKTRLQLQTAMHPNRPYSGLSDLRVLEGSTEALHPTC